MDYEVCPFGKNKGVLWRSMSMDQLSFYQRLYSTFIADKNNKFREHNIKSLEIINDCLLLWHDSINDPGEHI